MPLEGRPNEDGDDELLLFARQQRGRHDGAGAGPFAVGGDEDDGGIAAINWSISSFDSSKARYATSGSCSAPRRVVAGPIITRSSSGTSTSENRLVSANRVATERFNGAAYEASAVGYRQIAPIQRLDRTKDVTATTAKAHQQTFTSTFLITVHGLARAEATGP